MDTETGDSRLEPPSIAILLASSELGLRGDVLRALRSVGEWREGRGGVAVMLRAVH